MKKQNKDSSITTFSYLLLLFFFCLSNVNYANLPLWTATNQWNQNWENRYSEWFNKTIHTDYFYNHNMSTDCADVALLARWIFSYENSLPAVNSLTKFNDYFTHEIPIRISGQTKQKLWYKDTAFVAALNYLIDYSNTETLVHDTYTVDLKKESFQNGLMLLNRTSVSGHLQIVNHVNEQGTDLPLVLYSSTVPKELRTLRVEPLSHFDPYKTHFVKFRRPVKENGKWILQKKHLEPHYIDKKVISDKISTIIQSEGHIARWVYQMIAPDFLKNGEKILSSTLAKIKQNVMELSDTVYEGYKYCKKQTCPENSKAYDNWSTPSRIRRLKSSFQSVDTLRELFCTYDRTMKSCYAFNQYLKQVTLPLAGVQKTTNLYIIYQGLLNEVFSTNPNTSLAARWALDENGIYESLLSQVKKNNQLFKSYLKKYSCFKQQKCPDPQSSEWFHSYIREYTPFLDSAVNLDKTFLFAKNTGMNSQKLFQLFSQKDFVYGGQSTNLLEYFFYSNMKVLPYKSSKKEFWGLYPNKILESLYNSKNNNFIKSTPYQMNPFYTSKTLPKITRIGNSPYYVEQKREPSALSLYNSQSGKLSFLPPGFLFEDFFTSLNSSKTKWFLVLSKSHPPHPHKSFFLYDLIDKKLISLEHELLKQKIKITDIDGSIFIANPCRFQICNNEEIHYYSLTLTPSLKFTKIISSSGLTQTEALAKTKIYVDFNNQHLFYFHNSFNKKFVQVTRHPLSQKITPNSRFKFYELHDYYLVQFSYLNETLLIFDKKMNFLYEHNFSGNFFIDNNISGNYFCFTNNGICEKYFKVGLKKLTPFSFVQGASLIGGGPFNKQALFLQYRQEKILFSHINERGQVIAENNNFSVNGKIEIINGHPYFIQKNKIMTFNPQLNLQLYFNCKIKNSSPSTVHLTSQAPWCEYHSDSAQTLRNNFYLGVVTTPSGLLFWPKNKIY